MNMKKITKRDIYIFLLGMFVLLVIQSVYDWNKAVKDFKEGFNIGYNGIKTEQHK